MTPRQKELALKRSKGSLYINLGSTAIGLILLLFTNVTWLGWILLAVGAFVVVGELIQLRHLRKGK